MNSSQRKWRAEGPIKEVINTERVRQGKRNLGVQNVLEINQTWQIGWAQ